jgi:uncharacterized protein (TIGR03086 family)
VVPLSRELELLESAVAYALAGAQLATPPLLSRPTPCSGWDVEMLLDHVGDSIGVLREALAVGSIAASAPPGHPGPHPGGVARLRRHTAQLLSTCAAAGRPDRLVLVGERKLRARIVVLSGALEMTIHGWDISVACGALSPIPPVLAAVLLPIAPLLITPSTRPGLFADPVRLPGSASPGDQLVAFLGRHPRLSAEASSGAA